MPNDLATVDQTPWGRLIDRAISDHDFPIANIESLWRMKQENDAAVAKRAFHEAMAQCQAVMQPVIRATPNRHLNTKYASYDAIDLVLRPIYTAHGFSVTFGTGRPVAPGNICITCKVKHAAGWEEETLQLEAPPDASGSQGTKNKTPVQAVGSTVSYLRRYEIGMAFNLVLASDDDDGEGQRQSTATPRDRQADRAYPSGSQGEATAPRDDLAVEYGPTWVANLRARLAGATTLDAVAAIRGHPRVGPILLPTSSTPPEARSEIEGMFRDAYARLVPTGDSEQMGVDELDAMRAEIEAMDLIALDGLQASAQWRARERGLSFPDQDRLGDAIDARRIALKLGASA